MADISGFTDPIVALIYEQYEKRNDEQSRGYVGASSIGRECARSLWYQFRWVSKESFDGRVHRLFQTGHLAESRFVADLRSIGAKVEDVDPATGDQFGFAHHHGHMRGHMDGRLKNLPIPGGNKPHVVEFKTHSEKSFAKLKKEGVQKAKPEHYAQMMWYMGMTKYERALYLAVNKDTDELYSERIKFDLIEFEKMNAKAESIIFSDVPPPKLSDDPKYYICNMCSFSDVCHSNNPPEITCRTCVHSTPEKTGDGAWSCAKYKSDIPVDFQRKGCGNYLAFPYLLTFAEAMDAGDGWIMYRRKDNHEKQFIVVAEDAEYLPGDLPLQEYIYTSREIAAAKDHKVICDPEFEKLRIEFSAKIVG